MENNQVLQVFREALASSDGTSTKEELAAALREVPSGQYLCGCEWSGGIIPHFCPTHHQPPVFVIQEPRE